MGLERFDASRQILKSINDGWGELRAPGLDDVSAYSDTSSAFQLSLEEVGFFNPKTQRMLHTEDPRGLFVIAAVQLILDSLEKKNPRALEDASDVLETVMGPPASSQFN